MYWCPSMSWRYAPSARAMNGGSPPTAPNARAGLFTPPGITRLARTKASWLLGREYRETDRAGVPGVTIDTPLRLPDGSSDLLNLAPAQPSRHVESVIRQDHVCPGTLEAGEGLEHGAPLVDPAAGGGGLDHGVLARDVVGGDG